MLPTEEQALQFAIMLAAGLPAGEAILYFVEDVQDATELSQILAKWQKSRAVRRAMLTLLHKSWQDMSLDERIDTALTQHYNTLAYLLFSRNYIDAQQGDKLKLDTARQALEAKVAGTAGKTDALTRFLDDVNSGRVAIPRIPPAIKLPAGFLDPEKVN